MQYTLLTFFLLASVHNIVATRASLIEGRVAWNEVCPGYTDLGYSRVVLDDGRYTGGIRQDGSFSIPDVKEGSYLLTVIAHGYYFDTLRVDISSNYTHVPEVHPYIVGTPHNPPSPIKLQYPIVLVPRQKANYFVEHQSFDVLGMLRNPLILLMVALGLMVVGMPYLIKNLDPQLAREMGEKQARYSNLQNAALSGEFRSGVSSFLNENENINSVASPASQNGGAKAVGSTSRAKSNKGGKRR